VTNRAMPRRATFSSFVFEPAELRATPLAQPIAQTPTSSPTSSTSLCPPQADSSQELRASGDQSLSSRLKEDRPLLEEGVV
jgi:hypothetical protein